VISFDLAVGIPGVDVAGGGELFVEDPRVGRGPIGGHICRPAAVGQRLGEEPAGRGEIPFIGGEDVDDLAELVDRPVQVRPAPGDLHDEYGACKQS
jgi:hypothetical protein